MKRSLFGIMLTLTALRLRRTLALLALASLCYTAAMANNQHTVYVNPASQAVKPFSVLPHDDLQLIIKPPLRSRYEIAWSKIVTPSRNDTMLWRKTSHTADADTYDFANAFPGMEFMSVIGSLTTRGGGGGGQVPIFQVTVPEVDIDWDKPGYREDSAEPGEDTRILWIGPNTVYPFLVRRPIEGTDGMKKKIGSTWKRPLPDLEFYSFSNSGLLVYSTEADALAGVNAITSSRLIPRESWDGTSGPLRFFAKQNSAQQTLPQTMQEIRLTRVGRNYTKPTKFEGDYSGGTYDCIKFQTMRVELDKIAFNYKPTTATDDGLNIRENFSAAISVPEYVKGGQNKPAAYIKDKAAKVLVRMKAYPNTITSLKIRGVSDDANGSLGDATEKTVAFSGGISQEGADDPTTAGIDESEYVEFTITGNTPNKVFTSEEAWKWIVTEVNGTAVSAMEVERTSGHKVYVLWDTPKSPWNQTAGDTQNPWVNALEFAVVTCNADGKGTEDSAMSAITTQLYTIPYNGASQCLIPGGNFSYTDYMTTASANCLDSAVGLDATGSLLGMDMVGRRRTEFFSYNFHCFVKKGGHVYDSCSAMSFTIIKMDYTTYVAAGTPGAGSVETDETHPLE